MRIVVIGASGRSGREAVRHALAAGHEVVAVVRDAFRAPEGAVAAVAGARDIEGLTAAVRGADAVISALGHVTGQDDPTLLGDGAAALVEAMRAADVRRVVAVSAGGAYIAGDDPVSRFIAKPIIMRLFFTADTRAMDATLADSGLAWTSLRPSRLIDGEPRPAYRARIDRAVWWHYATRFATVGRAAVDALSRPEWVGHAVYLTE